MEQAPTSNAALPSLPTEDDAGLLEPTADQIEPAEALEPSPPQIPRTVSGLLAVSKTGEYFEPSQDDLRQMGEAMLQRIFGNPEVQQAAVAVDRAASLPPPPKLSENHCRLCNYFRGDDSRGPLWAEKGECMVFGMATPVPLPSPEHYCQRFAFNEGLRDAEPR